MARRSLRHHASPWALTMFGPAYPRVVYPFCLEEEKGNGAWACPLLFPKRIL